jgi:hypothetical protein
VSTVSDPFNILQQEQIIQNFFTFLTLQQNKLDRLYEQFQPCLTIVGKALITIDLKYVMATNGLAYSDNKTLTTFAPAGLKLLGSIL